jgi:rod shape-determining protein MreB
LENAGLASVSPASGLVGLSWYLNLATADEPCFVIDLGGSQTQVGILIRGTVFSSKTMGRGGIDVTTLVQQWLLQKYHCQVSWRAAEQLKCQHGSLSVTAAGTKKIALKGKDPYTQLGMTATIELVTLQEMLVTAQQDLVLFIRQFLASVPAEIATKCLENGLWLAGGASQLHDLEQWLSVQLRTPVSRVQDPTLAVSKGIAIWKASQTAIQQGV